MYCPSPPLQLPGGMHPPHPPQDLRPCRTVTVTGRSQSPDGHSHRTVTVTGRSQSPDGHSHRTVTVTGRSAHREVTVTGRSPDGHSHAASTLCSSNIALRIVPDSAGCGTCIYCLLLYNVYITAATCVACLWTLLMKSSCIIFFSIRLMY